MTRDDFKKYVEDTIEGFIQEAEKRIGHALPRRYCFGYCNPPRVIAEQEQVSEYLAQLVFVDEEHIYPCFDLILDDILDDGRLLFVGYRAHFKPRPWEQGFMQPGPFNLKISDEFFKKTPVA
jgi:hypothetical protein